MYDFVNWFKRKNTLLWILSVLHLWQVLLLFFYQFFNMRWWIVFGKAFMHLNRLSLCTYVWISPQQHYVFKKYAFFLVNSILSLGPHYFVLSVNSISDVLRDNFVSKDCIISLKTTSHLYCVTLPLFFVSYRLAFWCQEHSCLQKCAEIHPGFDVLIRIHIPSKWGCLSTSSELFQGASWGSTLFFRPTHSTHKGKLN
jgi:hypothetical protein